MGGTEAVREGAPSTSGHRYPHRGLLDPQHLLRLVLQEQASGLCDHEPAASHQLRRRAANQAQKTQLLILSTTGR